MISEKTTDFVCRKIGRFKAIKDTLENGISNVFTRDQLTTLRTVNYIGNTPNHSILVKNETLMANKGMVADIENAGLVMKCRGWTNCRNCNNQDAFAAMLRGKYWIVTNNM